jgi:hypothetical protein
MSQDDEYKKYFEDDRSDEDRLFVEVPTKSESPYPEKIPSPYDPMGWIHLEGKMARGFVGGNMPWWVLISGWFLFSCYGAVVMAIVLPAPSFGALPILIILAIFLAILWRGTSAKLAMKRRNSRRR